MSTKEKQKGLSNHIIWEYSESDFENDVNGAAAGVPEKQSL